MWRCDKCGNLSTKNPKICSCKIFCVIDVDGEEYEIRAMDAEEAALRYAEEANVEGDYYLMNNTEDITVDGMAFRVGAEPDVAYSVKSI